MKEEIFQAVLKAIQPSEEIHFPEGEYISLMEMIRNEVDKRIVAFNDAK